MTQHETKEKVRGRVAAALLSAAFIVVAVAYGDPAEAPQTHKPAPKNKATATAKAAEKAAAQTPPTADTRKNALGNPAIPTATKSDTTAPPEPAPPLRLFDAVKPGGVFPFLGKKVQGRNGENLGQVVDVLIDEDGRPQAAIVDLGGFLGVGTRRIAVDWVFLQFDPTDHDAPVKLDVTQDAIKAAPEYKPETPPPPPKQDIASTPGGAPAADSTQSPAQSNMPAVGVLLNPVSPKATDVLNKVSNKVKIKPDRKKKAKSEAKPQPGSEPDVSAPPEKSEAASKVPAAGGQHQADTLSSPNTAPSVSSVSGAAPTPEKAPPAAEPSNAPSAAASLPDKPLPLPDQEGSPQTNQATPSPQPNSADHAQSPQPPVNENAPAAAPPLAGASSIAPPTASAPDQTQEKEPSVPQSSTPKAPPALGSPAPGSLVPESQLPESQLPGARLPKSIPPSSTGGGIALPSPASPAPAPGPAGLPAGGPTAPQSESKPEKSGTPQPKPADTRTSPPQMPEKTSPVASPQPTTENREIAPAVSPPTKQPDLTPNKIDATSSATTSEKDAVPAGPKELPPPFEGGKSSASQRAIVVLPADGPAPAPTAPAAPPPGTSTPPPISVPPTATLPTNFERPPDQTKALLPETDQPASAPSTTPPLGQTPGPADAAK